MSVPLSAAAAGRCRWLMSPAGGLICAAHLVFASPSSRPRDCGLPVASLCHLCCRAAVPIRSRFDWSFVCPTCTRLESALARPYEATSMTPVHGNSTANTGTLYARMHPDLADRNRREERIVDGRLHVTITDDVPASPAGFTLLHEFHRSRLALMSATGDVEQITTAPGAEAVQSTAGRPMSAAGPGPYRRWDDWQAAFPASVEASARAYQAFVTEVHPWIESVEPRVLDLAWLSAVAVN